MDDTRLRLAAFNWLREQISLHGEVLPRTLLEKGFLFENKQVTLVGPCGIWKPGVLRELPLSITTTIKSPYKDRTDNADSFIYSFRDGDHVQNEYLKMAALQNVPLIYFHAVAKGRYLAFFPMFITGIDNLSREIRIQVGDLRQLGIRDTSHVVDEIQPPLEPLKELIRSYQTVQAKIRLHQKEFRERVLSAYHRSCACCNFKHEEMLDAAHIIPDRDGGEPVVSNGLSLCTLHHRAFDHALIGISPDFQIQVRPSLLEERDGPTLMGIQGLNGKLLHLPRSTEDRPDRHALERRYELFRSACG